MKVGYAQAIITPSLQKPVFLAGFGSNRRAENVHDALSARALTIQDESNTLVFVALDLIGFIRKDVYGVIQTVQRTYPDVQVIIASTHTHHGPDTLGLWGPDLRTSGVDQVYLADTKEKIAQAILTSLSSLKPAVIKTTSVQVPGWVKNARDPDILDDELTLLQFFTEEKQPFATMFSFPCHPEVLWEHNPTITADYVHPLREKVEKQTGAPCIFFSGALGGMQTPDVKAHSFAEAESMGESLAEKGLQALGKVSCDPLLILGESKGPVIRVERRIISAKLTNILYKLAFRRKLLPDVRDQKGYVTSEVNLIRIGSLWFATVPGELLPKLGLQLKAWMRGAGAQVTGIIGLANDELGYILPVEDFKYPWNPLKPGKHYEETNSIGKEIAPKIMGALKEIIR
jgi:hypothetical protein